MTNRSALFAQSIQCFSLTVMVMISSMNPSIDSLVDMISTAKGSAFARWLAGCCFSSCASKDWCGEFRSSVSQDSSRSRLLPMYIAASLTVAYYSGAGVVPKGNLKQRKASSSTIEMHVASVWMNNKTALFAQSIQCLSLTIMVMMSSMKPSIDVSLTVISTAKGSAISRWLADCCFYSCGIKDRYWQVYIICVPRLIPEQIVA